MSTVLKAYQFAAKKHRGQVRKGSGEAYVSHPIAVSYIVAAFKRSKHLDDLLIATILHDCLEDTDTTFEEIAREFSPFVAALVLELTNDPAEIAKVGKLAYQIKKLSGISNYALVIKLADRLHNISDQPTRKMVVDTIELMAQVRKARKLTKTQKALAAEIERLCQDALLCREPLAA